VLRGRGLNYWLPTYIAEALHRRRMRSVRDGQLTHLLFLVCDHYEPRHKATQPDQPAARVRAWHEGYKALQDECQARYGLKPLHSFFYPPHHGYEHLAALAHMAFDGLGEVELHFHHQDDTEESLRSKLQATLARFRRSGLLLQAGDPPVQRFGFIHGDWALDNSGHGAYCGVDSELSLLQELGCWADLTMPSSDICQTRKINSIYYAIDDPREPKSHDWGEDAAAGRAAREGFMLIQGPLGINWRGPKYPRIENASLTTANWGTRARIRSWIDCHVHVRGRPEWLFIKLHTHGAVETDFDSLFGARARDMHRMLAEQYNDGKHFKLHYVTARQAYNVIRAAEHGLEGDPSQYLDYELPPQVTAFYSANTEHDLKACTRERLEIAGIDRRQESLVRLRYPGIAAITGALSAFSLHAERRRLQLIPATPNARASIQLTAGASLRSVSGAQILGQTEEGLLQLNCGGPVELEYLEPSVQKRAVGA
jgi:hypothetical protein